MKVNVPGHEYELRNAAGTRIAGTLNFIRKEDGEMKADGTTTEEVLDALIDRVEFLQSKVPCKENEAALTALEKAKEALEKRTRDREKRGVEGSSKK